MTDSLYDEALKRVRPPSTSDRSASLDLAEIGTVDRYSIEAERTLRAYDSALRPADEEIRFMDRPISRIEIPDQENLNNPDQVPVPGSTQENTLQSGTIDLSPEEAAEVDRLLGRAPAPASTVPATQPEATTSADLSNDGKFSWSEAFGNAIKTVKDFAVSLTDPKTLLITGAAIGATVLAAVYVPFVAGGLVALAAATTVFSGSKFLSGIFAGGDEAEKAFFNLPELLVSALPFLRGTKVFHGAKGVFKVAGVAGVADDVGMVGRFFANLQSKGGQVLNGIFKLFGKGAKADSADELIKAKNPVTEFFKGKLFTEEEAKIVAGFKGNMKAIDDAAKLSVDEADELLKSGATLDKWRTAKRDANARLVEIDEQIKKLDEAAGKITNTSFDKTRAMEKAEIEHKKAQKAATDIDNRVAIEEAAEAQKVAAAVHKAATEAVGDSMVSIESSLNAIKNEHAAHIAKPKVILSELTEAQKKAKVQVDAIDQQLTNVDDALAQITDPAYDKTIVLDNVNQNNVDAQSLLKVLDDALEQANQAIKEAKKNVKLATKASEEAVNTADAAESLKAAREARDIYEDTKKFAVNLDDQELTIAIDEIEKAFKAAEKAALKLNPGMGKI